MTDTHYDRAPGDDVDLEEGASSGALVYTIGLLLAVILTAVSFWAANTSLLWAPGIALGLTVLAIAQMGVTWSSSCTSPPGRTTPTTSWRWRSASSS